MEHLHTVTDSDSHFIVDPYNGEIQNLSGKESIRQFSHNSERFTFELPRYIEGHDMSACNVVEVHFVNRDEKGAERRTGLREIDDLKIVTPETTDTEVEVEETVTCSWLIKRESTQLAGSLGFQLRFACVENGEVVYDWPSAVFDGMKVDPSIYASAQVAEEYADVIADHEARLDALEAGGAGSAEFFVLNIYFEESDGAVTSASATPDEVIAAMEQGKLILTIVDSSWYGKSQHFGVEVTGEAGGPEDTIIIGGGIKGYLANCASSEPGWQPYYI